MIGARGRPVAAAADPGSPLAPADEVPEIPQREVIAFLSTPAAYGPVSDATVNVLAGQLRLPTGAIAWHRLAGSADLGTVLAQALNVAVSAAVS